MARYKTKAIWYDLANAFCVYIEGHEHVLVTQQTIPGEDYQSAFIRVWELNDDGESLSFRVRDTILFRGDEIFCVNVKNNTHYIDLKNPKAYEQLLDWMKLCGLVKAETILTGELAPWTKPKQCLKS